MEMLRKELPVRWEDQKKLFEVTPEFKKSIRESWGVWDIVGTLLVVGLVSCFYYYFW